MISLVFDDVFISFVLAKLLVSLLVVNAMVNKLSEVFAPYAKKKLMKTYLIKHKKLDQSEMSEIEIQSKALDVYDGTYSDYVTMFEQYGYISLFSSIYPWVSLAALVNNVAVCSTHN